MLLGVVRKFGPGFLALLFLTGVAAGCSSAGGGGDVIKPEPTKNPMAERIEKSGAKAK
ncbi:hypothetical protein [Fimbriimonas ginsengisoli]|nr:hypothetical protein [Fimbriimonas ginsengisoli]